MLKEISRPYRTVLGAAALMLVAAAGIVRGGYWADTASARPTVDSRQVYFGDASATRSPSVLGADAVFAKLASYQQIRERHLTEKDPEYWIRMLEASDEFRRAVATAARKANRDLVAERGSVEWPGKDVPDITDEALAALADAHSPKTRR